MPGKKTRAARKSDQPNAANVVAGSGHTSLNLSTFPAEIIMMIVAAQQLTPRSLQVLNHTKLVNRRLYDLIQEQLDCNREFRKLVYSWTLFVPGTLIPYRAKFIEENVELHEYNDIMNFFEVTSVMSCHNIAVSDAYELTPDEIGAYGTWPDPKNPGFCYTTVTIYVSPQQFTRNLPSATKSLYDVSSVPNVVRSVLRLYDDISPLHTKEWAEWADSQPVYCRLVHVSTTHTMQQIFDAVAKIEGWNASKFVMHQKQGKNAPRLHPKCLVSEMVVKARDNNIAASPHMSWPSNIGAYSWRDFFMQQILNMVQQNVGLLDMYC
jgi:hypothetical protein